MELRWILGINFSSLGGDEKKAKMDGGRLVQLISEVGRAVLQERDQQNKWPVQSEEILEKASRKEGQR